MNRLERLSAILVRLQSRSVVTAREIAEQFDISIRTVYRDLKALEESGVPVCGEAGTGYSLVEGYKLPPLMFTTEEAISFLMAEKLVANLTDGDTYDLYSSGMDKIRAVLKTVDKDILENFDTYLHVAPGRRNKPEKPVQILQPLLRAVLDKKCIRMTYKAGYNLEITQRVIEPLGIFFRENNWYIVAWCRLRNDYRTFNLSRVLEITLEGSDFSQKHPDVQELMCCLYNIGPMTDIRVRIQKEFISFIGTAKYIYGFHSEEPDGDQHYIQHYTTNSPEYFCRWFLSFADKAEVLGPQKVKDRIKEIWQDIREKFTGQY